MKKVLAAMAIPLVVSGCGYSLPNYTNNNNESYPLNTCFEINLENYHDNAQGYNVVENREYYYFIIAVPVQLLKPVPCNPEVDSDIKNNWSPQDG